MEKIFVSIDNERFEATGELLEQFLADRAEIAANKATLEQQVAAAETAKISAIAKLTALGLTEEEAKAVIGIV
jgi:hypothetical protein